MSNFAQEVIKEINKFRGNPKSIQHRCELIRKGLSRLRGDDPFLKDIDAFVSELKSIKPLPQLKYSVSLSESAKKELPNFRGRESYQKIKRGNNIKGIVPDYYLVASPALVADDGADEPINVVTKTLLNKLDKSKEGRHILCDPNYTEVGAAHEVFDEENMVILIFATKHVEPEQNPIKSSKRDFLFNIQYHETKDIKKPKYEAKVHHVIKGNIYGGDNLEKMSYEMFSQGQNRPALDQRTFPTKLKSNKSEIRMIGKTSSSRSVFPLGGAATKATFESSTMRRRNDGTSSGVKTSSQTKTSSSRRFGPSSGGTTTSTTTTTTTRTVTSSGGTSGGTTGSSIRGKYSRFKRSSHS